MNSWKTRSASSSALATESPKRSTSMRCARWPPTSAKVPFCKTVDSCEGPGLDAINEDIDNEGLTKVVVAGISPRRYADDAFPDDVIVEKVALREHVVWCQPPGEEDTQMMAEDYLRMYIAKVQKMEPVEAVPARRGDRQEHPGGRRRHHRHDRGAGSGRDRVRRPAGREDRRLGRLAGQAAQVRSRPRPPYRELEDTGVEALIAEVEDESADQGVHVGRHGADRRGAGAVRRDAEIRPATASRRARRWTRSASAPSSRPPAGRPTEPREHLPYGKVEDVIRNVELEEMVKEHGRITRPSDGKEVKSIAFIQCGGSRDKEHHSYCSSICCLTSLKQALYLRESDDDAKAYIFYEFMRTPGHYEDFYRTGAGGSRRLPDHAARWRTSRGTTDGGLVVTAKNTMPGEQDRGEGGPGGARGGDGAQLRRRRGHPGARRCQGHGRRATPRPSARTPPKRSRSSTQHEGTEILNLDYRQGPDLPALEYGFPDSHFICFPYESRRTGIYPAGCVRQPMDGLGSREDAAGAALKAIQCVEMTSRGEAVHPRAGDKSYPDFFLQRCTQCKRCTEECPFGVLNEDEKGTPLLRATRCRRCGVCMGACPERIVSFKDYSVDIVASMIKAVEVPDEYEEKPRVLALAVRERRLPRPGSRGPAPSHVYPVRPRYPGAMPGIGQPGVGHGGDLGRLRRGHPDRLQVRRRLSVPLHQGQRAGRHARREHPGEAGTDGDGEREGRDPPAADFRISTNSQRSSTSSWR